MPSDPTAQQDSPPRVPALALAARTWTIIPAVAGLGFVLGWFLSGPVPPLPVQSLAGEPPELGIKDLITSVKQELQEAERERLDRNEAALFHLREFDLEVNFTIHQHAKAGVGGEYHFIAVTSEAEVGQQRTHRLVLHMDAARPEEGAARASAPPDDVSTTPVATHGRVPPPREKRHD